MTKFNITFELGRYQGTAMSLTVMAGGQCVYTNPVPDTDQIQVDFECDLPTQIEFIVAGKQPFETDVDKTGKIIADKHVRISTVAIDRILVESWIVESRLIEFGGRMTNYLHSNGTGRISIPNSDSFGFFLALMTKIDH